MVFFPDTSVALSVHAKRKTTAFARRAGLHYPLVKRALDIAIVVLTSPVSVLIIGILALIVRCDGGKAFYRQTRIGRHGKPFTLWKLRTMVPDSEHTLDEYFATNPAARKEWAETQKLRYDPRITRLGIYIRKYSLDELPQLWNVLQGNMSLVGPRPILPEQMTLYPGTAYFSIRPGLTGLWQTSVRNESPFAIRAAYDTLYAEKMSLRLDVWVLFLTAGVVFRGTGM
jgi:lipopolysaccharide/colanic/teichoic acid biosynthesis glycosyltransferase